MGAGKPSKHRAMGGANKGAMVARPAFPPQQPYGGAPVLYKHVIINATIDISANMSFFSSNINITSTNIDSYFPMLASQYAEGYRMLVFVSLPGSTRNFGLSQLGQAQTTVKFQGIFRRQFPDEAGQQWELRVEKSLLVNQMFYQWNGIMTLRSGSESVSNPHHIFQTINNVTQNGGRLLSVEMTGMGGQQIEMQRQMMQRRHLMNAGAMPVIEVPVDVFYEIPHHPTSERWVYQIVPCPMDSVFKHSFPSGRFNSTIDWQGVIQQYMGTGWKLVEIFEDYTASTQTEATGFTTNMTIRKNCLWIFEKPVSRLNDNTPYYEGTMVEHWFKTDTQMHGLGFGGVSMNVVTDWEPILEHMGNYGWQVVRILSTPDINIQGSFTMSMHTRQMIFFQRRLRDGSGHDIVSNMQPQAMSASSGASEAPRPPGYDELYPPTK